MVLSWSVSFCCVWQCFECPGSGYDGEELDGDDALVGSGPGVSTRSASLSQTVNASGSVVYKGNTHPKARMPGAWCVEIADGDARRYYGQLMAKLAANLGKWGRATPHHWRAMLIKVP